MKPVILLLLLACVASRSCAKNRPNIVFIMPDEHACNAIRAYGGGLAEVAPDSEYRSDRT